MTDTQPATVELLESVRPSFREAFEAAAFGEQLVWDITWAVTPTPNGPMAQLFCYLHVPAPHQLGALLQRVFTVPIGSTGQQIHIHVKAQVEGLKADRSKMLLSANGHGGQPGKLVIPG
ncbi:MAG: hypothetical protein ACRDQU_00840 [Pseudonocardiaceae bacterium]